MKNSRFFILVFLLHFCAVYSQLQKDRFVFGFACGTGEELKNKDYTYTNSFYKIHLGYVVGKIKHVSFEAVLQPEINFGTHQLLNKYFVKPDEPDYEALRGKYTKLKDVNSYILNIGVIVRAPVCEGVSVYALGSIGPMITDTETEHLSDGFAFSDVIALGVSLKMTNKIYFDLRPSLRHISNAGFQGINSGINTMNMEFQVSFVL
ncbi:MULTISPECIES: acyloxyacyl hydrolase [Flavobacterium]|uniref:acyloxyacyl hydrolase n=1 Tax=Flavobacterium TaxID=237 RepID=UPI001FCAFC67|nr:MULTISPECIES: acyloxyacyl hydrolase [Flavobacterium]UOK43110.1 acyloxyacyl hydrolase [Flavobacterium enshiense]